MNIFQSMILGAVQGITEFLPISSSGHLALIPWILNWEGLGLTFDMALHLGTLFAIVLYFWKDWVDILRRPREPLLWLILIGCIPAGVVGFKFEEYFETVFRDPRIIAGLMISFGLLIFAAEALGKKKREIRDLNIFDALFIGTAQVLALMPGVSRSGITMTAGLFSGLTRESSAKFSFLLSTPIIAGAGIFKMRHIFAHGLPRSEALVFFAGMLVSAVVGALTIKYLLQYLKDHNFYIFVWYRLIAGILILGLWLVRI